MRFLRHAVQGFSSAAADQRRVRRPVRPRMLRERAESAVGVGRFSECFEPFLCRHTITHTHTVFVVCVMCEGLRRADGGE